MRTITRDQVASVILKYLLHLLINAGFYFVLLYTFTSFWLRQLLNKFARVVYVSNDNFHQLIYFQLAIFTLFCYFANNFIFDLYHRKQAKPLFISIIADLLIIPLQVLIMIFYNNKFIKIGTAMENTLYNIYLITALIVVKELITGYILSRKERVRKARK